MYWQLKRQSQFRVPKNEVFASSTTARLLVSRQKRTPKKTFQTCSRRADVGYNSLQSQDMLLLKSKREKKDRQQSKLVVDRVVFHTAASYLAYGNIHYHFTLLLCSVEVRYVLTKLLNSEFEGSIYQNTAAGHSDVFSASLGR
jgi:hypothetical protein